MANDILPLTNRLPTTTLFFFQFCSWHLPISPLLLLFLAKLPSKSYNFKNKGFNLLLKFFFLNKSTQLLLKL
jgi:hypothetical protein